MNENLSAKTVIVGTGPGGATLARELSGRGEDVIIAHHDTVIEEHDHVLLFVPDKKQIHAVERLFQVSATYL